MGLWVTPLLWTAMQKGYDGSEGVARSRFQVRPPSVERSTEHRAVRNSAETARTLAGFSGSTATDGDECVRVGVESAFVTGTERVISSGSLASTFPAPGPRTTKAASGRPTAKRRFVTALPHTRWCRWRTGGHRSLAAAAGQEGAPTDECQARGSDAEGEHDEGPHANRFPLEIGGVGEGRERP